jgi:pyrroloquinoline quinone biosynthesis protein B
MGDLDIIVLGSAAGGGVPQWNCRCPVCTLVWAGDARVSPRTQSSLAVSPDGEDWLLVNASPDLRQQLVATPMLHPRDTPRGSPIKAVLLSNGDVDHVAGLLSLRERQPFALYASAETLDVVDANRIFAVLDGDLVRREPVGLDRSFEPLPGLRVDLFAVPGKVPLWLEGAAPVVGAETGSTVGVVFQCGGRRAAYVPGCAAPSATLLERIAGADLLLFDGTLFRDDEMISVGVGVKTGRRMGHMPMSGPDGSIAALASLSIGRRVFVHVNNTNPALIEGSPERREVEAAGWTIAHDGLAFSL